LMDLAQVLENGEHTTVTTNVVLPVGVDEFLMDDKKIETSGPFAYLAKKGSIVFLREGNAAVGIRLFAADVIAGPDPRFQLKYDGNKLGAARLVVYHYRGKPKQLKGKSVRVGVLIKAAKCSSDEAFDRFIRLFKNSSITDKTSGDNWIAQANVDGDSLVAALNISQRRCAWRRVNGKEMIRQRLSVNGRDLAAEILDLAKDKSAVP
jgi:hypothetical protein